MFDSLFNINLLAIFCKLGGTVGYNVRTLELVTRLVYYAYMSGRFVSRL